MFFCFPAVTCSAITLENGEVIYTMSPQNGEFPLNTVATFSCSPQSNLSGCSSSICQASGNSGNWNPHAPTCDLSIDNNLASISHLFIASLLVSSATNYYNKSPKKLKQE